MDKTHRLLGNSVDECIARIKERVSDDDPEWFVQQIIEYEVSKTCDNTPITFHQIEKVLDIYRRPLTDDDFKTTAIF